MPPIPDHRIERARSADLVELVRRRGVELKPAGAELRGLCPFHAEKSPSFYVHPGKNTFYCHGCGAGGDSIEFLRRHDGLSFKGAVGELEGDAGDGAPPARVVAPPQPSVSAAAGLELVTPIPSDAPPMPISLHVQHDGQWVTLDAVATWKYCEAEGHTLFYVQRFEDVDGKTIRPLTLWSDRKTGAFQWKRKAYPGPLPLYGLDVLAQRPEAQVLIVEGEKSADAARRMLADAGRADKVVTVTWPGGANGVAHVDLKPLRGRQIVIWPDADAAGANAADELTSRLQGIAAEVKRVSPPEGVEQGWDAADAEQDEGFDLLTFAKTACLVWVPPQRGGDVAPVAVQPALAATGEAMSRAVKLPVNAEPLSGDCSDTGMARDEVRRRQQQEENKHLQKIDAGAMIPSELSVDDMCERCVYIADSRNVAYVTEDRSLWLKFDEFRALTAVSRTEVEVKQGEKLVKKQMLNANLWQSDFRREAAMSITFRAGAPIITSNPDGLRAVNTWRPLKRWPATVSIDEFLKQIEYLFPDPVEGEAFLDFLAHIEQRPGELPHYGWLHIAASTGTGRNWLASLLARVFRGYVTPNVDLHALLDGQFNGELGSRLLAIVDEVQEGASEGNYRHAERLKSMVNAETRKINRKYGLATVEFNSCRWLVFSNHQNALPLTDTDRRFRVVMHNAPPRSNEVYQRLYALLANPAFINAVGVYLTQRDISHFNPGERPPMNDAKRAAISASKPMSVQNAEEVVAFWPSDVITYADAAVLLTGDRDKHDFTPAMRRAMEEAGAVAWQHGTRVKIKVKGSSHRVWILRDAARWAIGGTDALRAEIGRAGVNPLRSPLDVLADATEAIERACEAPL